ncbi:MAG: tetratricopeptide repeat protein, partial [Rhodomicrobium sp.]
MVRVWLARKAANVLVVAILTAAAPAGLRAQGADDIAALNRQAEQLYGQGKYREAAAIAEKALALAERVLGPEHPDTLISVGSLALLNKAQGRYGEAERLFKRALEVSERVLGPEHPGTLQSVNNLALLYEAQGRYGEAEPLHQRALAARERVLGPEHPDTLLSMNNLAAFYFERSDWAHAAEFWLRSTTAAAARTRRDAASQALAAKKKSEAEQKSGEFWSLVKAVHRLTPEGRTPDARASREMFET